MKQMEQPKEFEDMQHVNKSPSTNNQSPSKDTIQKKREIEAYTKENISFIQSIWKGKRKK